MVCKELLQKSFHEVIGHKSGLHIGKIKQLFFTVNNFLHYIKNSIDLIEAVKRDDIIQLLALIDETIHFPAKYLKLSIVVIGVGFGMLCYIRILGNYYNSLLGTYEGILGILLLLVASLYRMFDAKAAKDATELICKIWEMIDNHYQLEALQIHTSEDIDSTSEYVALAPPRN